MIDPQLDAALLDAIHQQWRRLVYALNLQLRPPVFALHEGRSRLGLWNTTTRTLSIAREHALQDPWLDVRETVLHELTHQVVEELYGGEATPHGPLFQRLLNAYGAMPVATGEEPVVIGRVRKLLALAGSSNRHEAELAMARAQRLMIAHRVELSRIDEGRGLVRRQLGSPALRQARWRSVLAALVGRHFFTEVLSMSAYLPERQAWGRVWEIGGRTEDVEMTAYAFDFVERTAERLWAEHLALNPRASRSRERFLLGVVLGFGDKLNATAKAAREEGLVPMGDPALAAAWRRRHPRVVAGSGQSIRADAHFHAGRSAGQDMVLHRPVGSRGGGGGLLEG